MVSRPKHNKYTFRETPEVLSGASEDMYTDDSLPRDWVNCAAQETMLNLYSDRYPQLAAFEIQKCIRLSECILMAIAAHEKEKGKRKPAIWMPGMAEA